MYATKLRGLALVAALLACSVSFAQASGYSPVSAAPMAQSDARIGVFRPTATPSEQATTSSQSLATPIVSLGKDYRVGPNDLLEIEVLDLDNVKRTVRVNAAGAISLPLIGAVIVAGLTAQQAEAHLADRYREKYLQNPQVSVFVKEFTTERITIDGAVVKPGIYPLTGQITLLRALALAGGFGPIADSSEVRLFRVNEKGERQVAVYDVELIRSGKSDDPSIKGDDLIVVQRDANRRMLKDSIFRDVLDSINPFAIFR